MICIGRAAEARPMQIGAADSWKNTDPRFFLRIDWKSGK